MANALIRFASESRLYVPQGRESGMVRAAYLLPSAASTPPTMGLADAIAGAGWFVVTGRLADAAVPAFEAAAQIWFANSARAGALLSWFTNAPQPAGGLAGTTFYASRSGGAASLVRAALVQFGNYTVNMPPGTAVAPSGDGNSLVFTAGSRPSSLAVTPFGQRNALVLPATTPVTLGFAGDPDLSGCLTFGFTANAAAFDGLDCGLRSFSAAVGGGYAQTALHRVFDFTGLQVALTAILDPLSPLDHQRSFVAFAEPVASVPTFYRNPVGDAYLAALDASGRLVFNARLTGVDAKGNPVPGGGPVYSLAPSGDFPLTLPPAPPPPPPPAGNPTPALGGAMMCGLSAVEYLAAGPDPTLTFIPDQPAFAPTLKAADNASGQKRVFGPIQPAGTTSWAYVSAGGGSPYFAQPEKAVLHQGMASSSSFLTYLPIQVATLPPLAGGESATNAFPLLPYGSTIAGPGMDLADLVEFERQAWAPARTGRIRELGQAPDSVSSLPDPPAATTPQGLLVDLGPSMSWAGLTLAVSSPPPPATPPRRPAVVIENVVDPLKSAFQANELFLVAADGERLLDGDTPLCSIRYLLTQERLDLLASLISDADCIARLKPFIDQPFADGTDLHDKLAQALTPEQFTAYFTLIRSWLGDFSLFAAGSGTSADAGWEFDLSPWRWADHKTILVFKFCKKQLAQLVGDTSQWSRPADLNADPGAVCQQMAAIFDNARKRYDNGKGDADLAYFVKTILSDPNWNGILVLNATVPLSGLPHQMEGLAAGIDASQFKAHHVGITVTPVTTSSSAFEAAPSSIFGLIDYEDPASLVSSDDWQFKVNSLKVLIANSQIADFSSRIELLINKLFGEPAAQLGASDNNLVFNGYYQKTGGIGSYVFVTAGPTAYRMTSGVLDQVAIVSATFVTLAAADPEDPTVDAKFLLNGQIAFLPQAGFDLFSYGPDMTSAGIELGLTYRNLSIDMTFDEATPSYKTFAFDAGQIILDSATSTARGPSLVQHFPMKLTGLVQGLGTVTPDSLGFMPVDSPLQGVQLTAPWFGLRFDLDLGSPGALAAATGFTAGLLLGWMPNPGGASVYVGLSLPGVSGGNRAISLEGVLSLVFGDVKFLVAPPTYMIQLGNIALKFLSVSFPPGGQVNMMLFGNPDAQTSGALGWYAAYLKNGAGGGSGGGGKNAMLAPPATKG